MREWVMEFSTEVPATAVTFVFAENEEEARRKAWAWFDRNGFGHFNVDLDSAGHPDITAAIPDPDLSNHQIMVLRANGELDDELDHNEDI